MPTVEYREGWIAMAKRKHHFSLYTCKPERIAEFRRRHPRIRGRVGRINFRTGTIFRCGI